MFAVKREKKSLNFAECIQCGVFGSSYCEFKDVWNKCFAHTHKNKQILLNSNFIWKFALHFDDSLYVFSENKIVWNYLSSWYSQFNELLFFLTLILLLSVTCGLMFSKLNLEYFFFLFEQKQILTGTNRFFLPVASA